MELLDRLREAPERAAILLDVDGVLAPIVERPEDARVPEETRAVLRALLARFALIAAVTGRPSDDAARMIALPDLVVVGKHGLEVEDIDPIWQARMREAAGDVQLPLEDKGVSLSIHYRRAEDEQRARAELEAVAERARSLGLKARFGRKVLELLPPIDVNKGTAIARLLERADLDRALYAGDDTTDLDAFAALDALELGVRVAVASSEAPPELLKRADIVVEGTQGLVDLLRRL